MPSDEMAKRKRKDEAEKRRPFGMRLDEDIYAWLAANAASRRLKIADVVREIFLEKMQGDRGASRLRKVGG